MSVESILKKGRRRRELLMRSQATVTRVTGEGAWDSATGTYGPPTTTTVYSGKAEIQHAYNPSDREIEAGDQSVQARVYAVVLPFGSPIVQTGDVLTVTASDNEWVVNVPLRVAKTNYGSNRTAQRFTVTSQDYVGGEYGGI